MPGNGAVGASYGDLLVTSLIVLGGVCIAAFVVVRLVGRFLATGRTRGAHLLDVVARLPLEPRRSLYVVEVAGKTLLIGTSEMGLSMLSELDASEVRARVAERPSFGDLVRTAWLRRRRPAAQEPRETDQRYAVAPQPMLDARDPTAPDPTAPDPTAPGPTAPDPTAPDPTAPDPTAPDPTAHGPTAQDPTAPRALDPAVSRRALDHVGREGRTPGSAGRPARDAPPDTGSRADEVR